MSSKHQKGVGLIEVLVALLILSIAILGFIALQYRALEAANEAYARTQAMQIARDLGERIRANQFAITGYVAALKFPRNAVAVASKNDYTSDEFAQLDANEILQLSQKANMEVALAQCEGTQRYCIYVAWGTTKPTNADDTHACTTNGTYRATSQCIVVEAYQ